MFKTRFISMLVLLMTAVTGAWADDTYTVQFKANGNTKTVENVVLPHQFRCNFEEENGELDQIIKELYGWSSGCCQGDLSSSGNENVTCGISGDDDYITISAPFEGTATVTGRYYNGSTAIHYSLEISIPGYVAPVNVTGVSLSETTASMTVGGDALTLTATVAPDDATNKTVTWTTSDASVATVADGVVTAVAAGTATITATANDGSGVTGTCTVTVSPAGYSVALKEGTDDAANWQGKAGEGEYQALPLTGLEANTAVSVKYSGTKKVKSVKAVKKASAGPVTYTELKGGEVLHVGDIINLSEEISFNHGDYYMGSYGSPYTVVRADLTINEYEETVVNEKADGNYYVIKKANDGGYYHFERALGVTDKSDGILVTYNGKSSKWLDYTFTVHEP